MKPFRNHHSKEKFCTQPSYFLTCIPQSYVTLIVWTFHIYGIIEHVVFHVWLLWWSTMISRLICVVARITTPFFFTTTLYSIVWRYHMLFICSSFDGNWLVSTLWLKQITLLWASAGKVFADVCFLFSWEHNWAWNCCVTYCGPSRLLSKAAVPF